MENYRNKRDVIEKPNQMRKIKPTRRSVSGVFSFRNESGIEFESTLERDFLIRTEFSLHVMDIIPQPYEIPFTATNGRTYNYTPDFLVCFRLGNQSYDFMQKPRLVEVKPRLELKKFGREWFPKWKAAHRFAIEKGITFHIFDESRIHDQTFENIKFLERYKRMNFESEFHDNVLTTVQSMGCAPFHYILAMHFMGLVRPKGIAFIWHLLAVRKLDCDMSRPLDEYTELWIPNYGN